MTDAPQHIPDSKLIEAMKRAVWRDDARHAGIAEADIERSVFLRWRLVRAGRVDLMARDGEGETTHG